MPSQRKFYRNVYTIIILSEDEPLGELTPEEIDKEITHGNGVLMDFRVKDFETSPKRMAELLYSAGSEPVCFRLTDNGEDIEEDANRDRTPPGTGQEHSGSIPS